MGGTVFGARRCLAGAVVPLPSGGGVILPEPDLAVLAEAAETILPATARSGGAKAAGVAAFMQEIAGDFYDEPERALLQRAPGEFEAVSRAQFGRGFLALAPAERFDLLLGLERQDPVPDFYRMVKQLTLWGYWTSEVAAKEALHYLPVPGRYEGCLPADPGARATAE